jgi:hypothetical protein
MMTAEELEKALGARLAKSRLAYRRGLLAEFCNWWAWRMRADGRPRSLRSLADCFRRAVRDDIDRSRGR